MSIRSDAQDAAQALESAGDLRHARAVRRLLNSHAALSAQVSHTYDELIARRRRSERAAYRDQARYV